MSVNNDEGFPAGERSPPFDGGTPSYVDRLPRGLRTALATGRWLPLIGAGLSANATTTDGRRPPAWAGLGQKFGQEAGLVTTNPIDSLSAFQSTYDRSYLINRLAEVLLIDEVLPGATHRAFARLPFDMIVTTNVDFLLERAYQEERQPCVPLIGEAQLTIARRPATTYVLKFHGDLYHPTELVITEDDYDGFLQRNPVLTTYLSSLFLHRDPVLIGYSLDDPDLREILALLRERLGRMARSVWAILPTDPNGQEPKFARRGIKPVVLESNASVDRSTVLTAFFGQLRALWEKQIAARVRARSDATTAELRRHSGISPQLALTVASRSLLALYRDFVFPSVPQSGLIALSADDIQSGDSSTAPMAIDIALSKAAVVVYDTGHGNPLPLEYVAARRRGKPIVLVTPADGEPPLLAPPGPAPLVRPDAMSSWPDLFVEPLITAMRDAQPASRLPVALTPLRSPAGNYADAGAPELAPELGGELATLRDSGDWSELLLTALALLEGELRGSEAPQVGASTLPTTGGAMGRLRDYFGPDFDTIVQGVRMRHDLLQRSAVDRNDFPVDQNAVSTLAQQLDAIVRARRGLPAIAPVPSVSP